MSAPALQLASIADPIVQENFSNLADFYRGDPFSRGEFKFFEFVIPSTNAAISYPYSLIQPHGLGFMPKDVILLHNLNNVAVTWEYSSFTVNTITVTVGAATTLRALIGRFNG